MLSVQVSLIVHIHYIPSCHFPDCERYRDMLVRNIVKQSCDNLWELRILTYDVGGEGTRASGADTRGIDSFRQFALVGTDWVRETPRVCRTWGSLKTDPLWVGTLSSRPTRRSMP